MVSELEAKMYDLCAMKERLISDLRNYLSRGVEYINAKEAGDVADMIKDLADAEKLCYEACYYKTVIKAMEERDDEYDEDGPMGYNPNRNSSTGQYTSGRSGGRKSRRMGYNDRPWKPYMDQEPYVNGYLESGRPMGYNEPSHEQNMDRTVSTIKEMWGSATPDQKKQIKAGLTKLMSEMNV